MKKTILFLVLGIFTLGILSSCSKDKNKTSSDIILGTWKYVNGEDAFMETYNSDGTFVHWEPADENNKEYGTWLMTEDAVYDGFLLLTLPKKPEPPKSVKTSAYPITTLKSMQADSVTYSIFVNFPDDMHMVWYDVSDSTNFITWIRQ